MVFINYPDVSPPDLPFGGGQALRLLKVGVHRADLNDFVGATLLIVGAVLPVINPVGDVPLFLDMTDGLDPATRNKLAARVATYSFGLLLGSMLLGSFVLRFFDLSLPVVQVAGGAVVCALGWKLLNRGDAPQSAGTGTALRSPRDTMELALYPLTLPLTVDPGSISVAITMGVNHAHGIRGALMRLLTTVVSSGIIAALILLTYRNAWRLGRWVGQRWMAIVFRLSAFIALCIGVQIVWNGAMALAADIRLL